MSQSFPSKLIKMLSLRFPFILPANRYGAVLPLHVLNIYFVDISGLNHCEPLDVFQKAVLAAKSVNSTQFSSVHSISNFF